MSSDAQAVDRTDSASESQHETTRPTEAEAFWFWLKLGCISFGGPAGQIAIMHDELVERRRWISERRFLHALNFCMALPGPEAQQLASYIGYSMYGVRGAITTGGLFVLPVLRAAVRDECRLRRVRRGGLRRRHRPRPRRSGDRAGRGRGDPRRQPRHPHTALRSRWPQSRSA